jgi:hypothetical protein
MARTVSRDPEVQARYERLLANGESHGIAEVLATRSFPGVKTDATFNVGRCNGNQFESQPGLGDFYRGVAAEHGVSVTGKTYLSQLAEFPGDPRAWVSSRGEVAAVCEERGYSCDGAVNVAPADPGRFARPDGPEVADDIIDDCVDDFLESDPSADPMAARERIIELRTGKTDNNPLIVNWMDPNAPDIFHEEGTAG